MFVVDPANARVTEYALDDTPVALPWLVAISLGVFLLYAAFAIRLADRLQSVQ